MCLRVSFDLLWLFAVVGVSKKTDHPGRALTVREVGALSDLDNLSVRIADVAADLSDLGIGSVMNSAPRLFHNS